MMDKEMFELERELYYKKKERISLLLQIPERSMMQKTLPYIIWFLAFSAAKFVDNWVTPFFNQMINYFIFLIPIFTIIFLDLLRAAWKDHILKQVRKYSDEIKQMEREMRRRKLPE